MNLKSCFSAPLTATYIPDQKGWMVHDSFKFFDKDGTEYFIPAGWVTDLASTQHLPPLLYKLFSPDGPWNQCACVHDFYYASEIYPRKRIDDLFREAMECVRAVPRWKIPLMYAAVRMFGGFTYREHTEERIKKLRSLVGVSSQQRPLYQ